ncbi:MAG: glycosyltransferase family 9 protein [Bdellovibrionales bacterium]
MKILVVSLLRLGDVFLAAPALAGIKRRYPDAELHLLVNRQAAGAISLLGMVDRWHIFERDLLQQGLTDAESPILEPFYRLEGQLQKLRGYDFDMVLNFTHNRLSGWLCGIIGARQTIGLALDSQGRPRFGSNWFQFLNDRAEERGREIFHYSDVFWFGGGMDREARHWRWQLPAQAKVEADALLQGKTGFIALQPLTSESKKEWGSEHWVQALQMMQQTRPQSEFVILGAPNERERCEVLLTSLREKGVRAIVAICSLGTAVEILSRAEMLLTGDTSIKHLAAALPLKVIEISLGSSDWRRTGIYKSGAYIVQARVPCAPCPHSLPCSESFHRCGAILPPDFIAKFGLAVLGGEPQQIQDLARAYAGACEIYQTSFSGGGYWQCLPVGRAVQSRDLRMWLDKLTTKLLLQGEHLQALGAYGTEAMRMGEWMRKEFPHFSTNGWQELIRHLEGDDQMHQFSAQNAQKKLTQMMQATRSQSTVQLKEMRVLQAKVEDISRRIEIRHRLVRSLRNIVEGTL